MKKFLLELSVTSNRSEEILAYSEMIGNATNRAPKTWVEYHLLHQLYIFLIRDRGGPGSRNLLRLTKMTRI